MKRGNPFFFALFFFLFASGCVEPIGGLLNGMEAPQMEYKTPQGETIPLNNFRGKIVLIDFWASWCKPCRKNSPKHINLYQQYRDKEFIKASGFEIYSVSLDEDKKKWMQAIEQDEITWQAQVSPLNLRDSILSKVYAVEAVPTNYLLDQNGIIIGKNLSFYQIEKELKRRLK